ncbi:hypothetical protein A2U01_0035003, partial [Trifolium medium]|nr:hypothetical protein [Trifolium medium]
KTGFIMPPAQGAKGAVQGAGIVREPGSVSASCARRREGCAKRNVHGSIYMQHVF